MGWIQHLYATLESEGFRRRFEVQGRRVLGPAATSLHGRRLFGMLALLYFAQGLPSGLIAKALPPLLREQGVSLSAIGFTSLLALPWALKFAWAPFIDRYGSRKRWLLVLNSLTMALMMLVASRDFAAWVDVLPLLLAVLFCMNLVSATQDIATDGYAVTTLKPEWRGLGNSIQVIGYKFGMVTGSGVLLWLVARHGWQMSYGGLACLMLGVIVPVLFMDDPPTPAQQAATHTPWRGWRGYARRIQRIRRAPGAQLVAPHRRHVQIRGFAGFADDGAAAHRQRLLARGNRRDYRLRGRDGRRTGRLGRRRGLAASQPPPGTARLRRAASRGPRRLPARRCRRAEPLHARDHRVLRAVCRRAVHGRVIHDDDGSLPTTLAGHRLHAAGIAAGAGDRHRCTVAAVCSPTTSVTRRYSRLRRL